MFITQKNNIFTIKTKNMKKTITIILIALFALRSYSQKLNYKQRSKEE